MAALLGTSYYRLRTDSIFACPADGYSTAHYLIYCQSTGYGDFDHGAFWFNLEPDVTHSAKAADVLFLGNSRLQYGFSTTSAREWLSKNATSYFLMGFTYDEKLPFQRALLRKLSPRARVYVINLDSFFEEDVSVPAAMVMNDPSALSHYEGKQRMQYLHRAVCASVPGFCGNYYALFRDRRTGAWLPAGEWQSVYGAPSTSQSVTFDQKLDAEAAAREIASGDQFLNNLGVDRRCVIFTLVPTVGAPSATSAAIAAALHVDFIVPQVTRLVTFDGSHLDRSSAEKWSRAFFDAAGPKIRGCEASQTVALAEPAQAGSD